MSAEPIGETDLLAYVDGHLDPARRRLVERHLATHADDARRIAADLAINEAIRRLFNQYFDEPIPGRLAVLLTRPAPAPRWLRPVRRAAAAVVLLAGGAAVGWHLSADKAPMVELSGVERFADGPFKPVALNSEPPRQPADWLAESLRTVVRVPDLSAAGLRLIGQALVGSQDRPAVQFTYEDRHGRRTYLFLQARWDDVGPQQRGHDGRREVVYWAEGPVVFAIAGDAADTEDLRILAEVAKRANEVPQQRRGVVPVVGR